jgi:hypothetical protein
MWDMNEQVFHVGVHTLTLDIDKIYLLTILSCHGARVSLSIGSRGGERMDYDVANHSSVSTEKPSDKVPIKNVFDISLRMLGMCGFFYF